jgi:chromosome segregation ATPase
MSKDKIADYNRQLDERVKNFIGSRVEEIKAKHEWGEYPLTTEEVDILLSTINELKGEVERLRRLYERERDISEAIDAQRYNAEQEVVSLTQEVEKLNREITSHAPEGRNYTNAQYVQLRQENERIKEENRDLKSHLTDSSRGYGEKWKDKAFQARKERDELKGENERLIREQFEFSTLSRQTLDKYMEQRDKAQTDLEMLRIDFSELKREVNQAIKLLEKAKEQISETVYDADESPTHRAIEEFLSSRDKALNP